MYMLSAFAKGSSSWLLVGAGSVIVGTGQLADKSTQCEPALTVLIKTEAPFFWKQEWMRARSLKGGNDD